VPQVPGGIVMLVGAVIVQLCVLQTKLLVVRIIVSILTPLAPAAVELLSVAARHLSLIGCH